MCKVVITTQSCGCKGFNELRVAFGNMKNCQLKCVFCFTREQKPADDLLSNLNQKSMEEVKIIRFTGGEPLLSQTQIDGMLRELSTIENKKLSNLDLIVIQTNALNVEDRDLRGFYDIGLPILFEVSFKGTNVTEYRYLTFENQVSDEIAKSVLAQQTEGYRCLVRMFEDKENIAVLARLGIFHSGLKRPMFKFVFPSNEKRLMFSPKDWDPQIREVHQDQKGIWNEIFNGKLVIERIKTPADGSPGIGRRYRRVIEYLKSKNLLIEDSDKSLLPEAFSEKYYYQEGTRFIKQ